MPVSATFSISCVPVASNDLKTGAIRLTGEGVFSYDTTGATATTLGNSCSDDVWYVWSATCTGTVTVTSCGFPLDSTALMAMAQVSASSGPSSLLT